MGLGEVLVGRCVQIGFPQSPLFFSSYCYLEARNVNSSIEIGANTWINNNFCAIAEHQKIIIGERCFIGINVEIYDSDFHGYKLQERHISSCDNAKSVSIGNDVFLGSNCKILKGVTIGSGAIIAAGSVVVSNIAPMVIAGGNPAAYIKKIEF
jgi:maltose O-acetyltransferase